MNSSYLLQYLPIGLMFIVAVGFVGVTMWGTHAIGPKRKTKIKLDTFECGIDVKGNARLPFNIKYFLVAILFVLFDVEVIFMYPWAVNFKEFKAAGGAVTAFVEMMIFVAFLLIGFFYLLKKGALKWEE